jgi:excisionase family DNA binding protein
MNDEEPGRDLLTRSEVALLFEVTPETVTRWARDGDLPYVRLPGGRGQKRFRRATVAAMLAERRGADQA